MLAFEPSLERVNYLASRIAEMSLGKVNLAELGSIALELLVIKEYVKEKMKNYSEKEKREAEKILEQLNLMEKSIVQMYFYALMQKTVSKKENLYDYIISKYSSR